MSKSPDRTPPSDDREVDLIEAHLNNNNELLLNCDRTNVRFSDVFRFYRDDRFAFGQTIGHHTALRIDRCNSWLIGAPFNLYIYRISRSDLRVKGGISLLSTKKADG